MAQVEDRFGTSVTGWRLVAIEAPGRRPARCPSDRRFTQGVGVTLAIRTAGSAHILSTEPSRHRNEQRRRRGGTSPSARIVRGTRSGHPVGQSSTGVLRWVRDVDLSEYALSVCPAWYQDG